MKFNYENRIEALTAGSSVLYEIIKDLNREIRNLPGCRFTANIKNLANAAECAADDILESILITSSKYDVQENQCPNASDEDDSERDIPSNSDLAGLLNAISEIVSSDKPVTISADIYINESKEDDETDEN